ncbi:MAG: hypothetical protein AVDCRST_MAG87-1436 [uncultured Thermomicrobiales bacterium]|uniref:Uncharacterized protein n=1 Tax=uncultured Thermomicrobiales bacterium TaxID=1645740 RepID=A0A6J4URX4_9BACT|nr:MAG: hypothetical protein AVDCRST_MAG87-1436 [uncultured Thermomicrobiales bacterium]
MLLMERLAAGRTIAERRCPMYMPRIWIPLAA